MKYSAMNVVQLVTRCCCVLSCTALHHNNCMYVAHHLITIDKVFERRLSAADGTAAAVLGGPPAPASPRSLPVATSAGSGVVPRQLHRGPGGPRSPGGGPGGMDGGSKLMDVVAWVKRLGNDNFTQHVNAKKQQLAHHLRTARGSFVCTLIITNSTMKREILCDMISIYRLQSTSSVLCWCHVTHADDAILYGEATKMWCYWGRGVISLSPR